MAATQAAVEPVVARLVTPMARVSLLVTVLTEANEGTRAVRRWRIH